MKRILRLLVLIGVGIISSVTAICLANYFIMTYSITALVPQATIIAGIITLLGTIFSAVYKELSSYYQSKSDNAAKKWELILPFIKNHYYPWINSANSLSSAIQKISESAVKDDQAVRVLYLTAVFFGYRLNFVIKDGGLILLSTTDEEKKVNDDYKLIKDSFNWVGTSTPSKISELQDLFISKNKPENPYVLIDFTKDVENTVSLQTSRDEIKKWLENEENRRKLNLALNKFASDFKIGIDKLYTDWE